jgi:hypothetical protein
LPWVLWSAEGFFSLFRVSRENEMEAKGLKRTNVLNKEVATTFADQEKRKRKRKKKKEKSTQDKNIFCHL